MKCRKRSDDVKTEGRESLTRDKFGGKPVLLPKQRPCKSLSADARHGDGWPRSSDEGAVMVLGQRGSYSVELINQPLK